MNTDPMDTDPMDTDTIFEGFVLHEDGTVYVQRAADNAWGFELCGESDHPYPGGVSLGGSWQPLDDGDPRITDAIWAALGGALSPFCDWPPHDPSEVDYKYQRTGIKCRRGA